MQTTAISDLVHFIRMSVHTLQRQSISKTDIRILVPAPLEAYTISILKELSNSAYVGKEYKDDKLMLEGIELKFCSPDDAVHVFYDNFLKYPLLELNFKGKFITDAGTN